MRLLRIFPAPTALLSTFTLLTILCQPARAQLMCVYDTASITCAIEAILAEQPQIEGANFRVEREGRLVYEQTFGLYTIDTVVPIASATKWISGAVIMALVDRQIIDLEEPVSVYLPSFNMPGLDQITFGQCFSHISGLPGTSSCHPCLGDRFTTLQDCAQAIGMQGLRVGPGTDFAYGGCSMQVAGAAVEIAAGFSWKVIARALVLNPLDMTSTTFSLGANPRIAGGVSSSLRDYSALLRMILNEGNFQGQQILSPLAVNTMLTDHVGNLPRAYVPPAADAAFGYGVGNWVNFVDTSGAAIQSSSEGAFGFSPWIDRTRRASCVFLVEDSNQRVRPLVEELQVRVRLIVDTSPDVDGDGVVAFSDITQVLANWGMLSRPGDPLGPGPIGDVNGDGEVNFGDVTRILGAWGCSLS